jgi:hypothetical protein
MNKDKSVLIKLSDYERDGFKRAAQLTGVGFSAWARQVLIKEASKVLKSHGESHDFLKKD